MKDKANTDVNADAKNVYSFLEQDTKFPYSYVPSIYISLGYPWTHTYSLEIQVWHFYLYANLTAISTAAFLRALFSLFTLAEYEKIEPHRIIGISSNNLYWSNCASLYI